MAPFLLTLWGALAHAQGFDGQRHTPPTGAAGGLAVERATIPASGSAGVYGGFAAVPVIFRRNGEIIARPLQSIFVLDAMGSVGIVDLLELGISVPVAPVYQGDELIRPEYSFAAGPGVGDVRLVPKVALLGESHKDGVRLGVAVPIRLPTGNEDALRGSGEPAIEPSLLVGGVAGPLGLHATAGFRFRPGLDEADLVGNEVTYGLALALGLLDNESGSGLDLLLEGFGAIDVNRPGPELTDYPLELHVGLAYRPVADWTLTLGGGPGLTGGLGTPDGRVFAGVRWAPRAEAPKAGRKR